MLKNLLGKLSPEKEEQLELPLIPYRPGDWRGLQPPPEELGRGRKPPYIHRPPICVHGYVVEPDVTVGDLTYEEMARQIRVHSVTGLPVMRNYAAMVDGTEEWMKEVLFCEYAMEEVRHGRADVNIAYGYFYTTVPNEECLELLNRVFCLPLDFYVGLEGGVECGRWSE